MKRQRPRAAVGLRGSLRRVTSLRPARAIRAFSSRLGNRMDEHHLFLSAAALSFNTLICFIPLVLLLFFILGLTLDVDSAIATIDVALRKAQLVPVQREHVRTLVDSVLREFVGGSKLAGFIGAIGLLWTSSALFSALRTILNGIFGIRETPGIIVSKLKDIALVAIVGVAFLGTSIAIYATAVIQSVGRELFGDVMDAWSISTVFSYLVSFAISVGMFGIVFVAVPDRRLRSRTVLMSSAISAVLWLGAKVGFGYYFTHLWSIGRIYGPYAFLASIALWVYYSSVTLLVAAEIGATDAEQRFGTSGNGITQHIGPVNPGSTGG